MSDIIKHECGIALIRLLKPLEHYQFKYGTWMYGLNKLYLMMEKQHNRGQDGAGIASLKMDINPGKKYIHSYRSNKSEPIKDVFSHIKEIFSKYENSPSKLLKDANWARENLPYAADLYLGHLRYGTFGKNNIENVHPVMRENNWKTRNLVMAGNFNLTNVDELFSSLIKFGQHPKDYSDTVTILEKVGLHLDEENQQLFAKYKNEGFVNEDISEKIAKELDIQKVLMESSKDWDGGYTIAGLLGHGDAFVCRDPNGIRPAFYYHDDEIAVVASERPVIQTVLNVDFEQVNELQPGNALIIKRNGHICEKQIRIPLERKSCSFERIYFSRGSDKVIYNERKKLGELITPAIIKAIDGDFENTVFSYIPNTAETAFFGMIKSLEEKIDEGKKQEILKLKDKIDQNVLDKIVNRRIRVEKIAIKDIKLRTFISNDKGRNDLVGHVYDITYGALKPGKDKLVIIDDSIVRGTTLKQSIIRILDRLGPKKIIVVSSAPQIRYPDCYGIDMAKLGDFIAFQAAIELLKETNQKAVIDNVYTKSIAQKNLPKEQIINYVKNIYKPFTAEQISAKISELLKPKNTKAEVEIVYQSIENLHKSCPNDLGDWYFTGNYPTPGGNKAVNNSFINYIEKNDVRSY
ncbi:MAG: amidophosphoribosyltransferase [Bacteroidetes bacterium]|jgi:amidophosphoribosyltransferase|nr:amidophosphoribosyltransferase [Bacteroidota bacterium]MBT6685678.1 amidophosphoribosyltransferase [Bacteroidota bacterium]MBT7141902.1 amidophosphoribosyltransferase [Bacteroidota bacterium]MBT7491021.1 amidophosphoribosyltransferase [Bacteroidota bacterium]